MKKISRCRTSFGIPGKRWSRLHARLGAPDGSLTENGGLMLVAELDRTLGVTAALDAGIGPVKERDRGLSGGEFALAMAAVPLVGEDHLVGFDRLRADAVGEGLLPAPVSPSTTAATLAARFGQVQREGLERASAELTGRALAARPAAERARILSGRVTIDLDAKDIEVFSTRKEQVVRSDKGEIAGRVHPAHWAQADVVLVADLLDGRSDGRTHAPGQVDRAVDAVRAAGTTGRILFQGDSGYYAGKVAEKIVARGCLFRLGVPRSRPLWRAVAAVHEDDWIDALGLDDAQVAMLDYVPAGSATTLASCPPTRARAAHGPWARTSSLWSWTASPTMPTPTRSSPPTRNWIWTRRSRPRSGSSATAPRSRSCSATPLTGLA
ncbi:transposase [Streptomyces sp. NPDC055722]